MGRELFSVAVTAEKMTAEVDHLADGRTQHHVTFMVQWTSANKQKKASPGEVQHKAVTSIPSMPTEITPETFCHLFPFHVVFLPDLQIVQWGQILSKMLGVHLSQGLKMEDVFFLSKPRMALTFEHIMKFINAVYVLKLQVNRKRVKGYVPTKQEGLTIKGNFK